MILVCDKIQKQLDAIWHELQTALWHKGISQIDLDEKCVERLKRATKKIAEVETWGAIECLDYIREYKLPYNEPEETADVDLDEVRNLIIETTL
jgi:hypothetical protein